MRYYALVACVLGGALATARADVSQPGSPEELAHSVRARLVKGAVHLAVDRQLRGRGDGDENLLLADIPLGATIQSLSVKDERGHRRAALLENDAASQRYAGGTGTKRSATRVLAGWSNLATAYIKLFPMAEGDVVHLRYSMTGAPCYANGVYAIAYPAASDLRPMFRLAGRDARVIEPTDPEWEALGVACDRQGYVPPLDASYWLVFPRHASTGVKSTLGVHSLSADRHLMRLEVDAGQEVAPAAAAPSVVFVVDGSRSMTESGLATQWELMQHYIAESPGASFEVVSYARFPTRHFGRFVSAQEIAARLSALRGEISLSNGSHLERAVQLAGSLVVGRGGPVRVVAFTDGRVRKALDGGMVARALPTNNGVLHLVNLQREDCGAYHAMRSDGHPLAAAALAHGGMMVKVKGQAGCAGARGVVRPLVRPVRVDGLEARVGTRRLPLFDGLGGSLEAGQGIRHFVVLPERVRSVELSGWIWGKKFRKVVRPSPLLSRRVPSLVFGDQIWEVLTDSEHEALGSAAGVLSPVRSFVTTDGSRPNRPLAPWGIGGGRMGPLRSVHAAVFDVPDIPRRDAPGKESVLSPLGPAVAACAARHGVDSYQADLRLEVDRGEIVDVLFEGTGAFATCVREAAWQVELSGASSGAERAVLELQLAN